MSTTLPETLRGPILDDGSHMFNQERLERDYELTQCIKQEYTPAEPTAENPHPRIVDGTLTPEGQDALASLWDAYQPATLKVANRLYGRFRHLPGIELGDLVQEGFYGLYHSAVKWDPAKNITFLTHLDRSAANYMQRYIGDNRGSVRLPARVRQSVDRVKYTAWSVYGQTEHMPTRTRLAKVLGISVHEVDDATAIQALADEMGSIDNGFFEDDRDRKSIYEKRDPTQWKPIDPSASEQRRVDEEVVLQTIVDAVDNIFLERGDAGLILTDTEREVIRLRFLSEYPLTLKEIGEHLGYTREHVRKIEAKTLSKIRTTIGTSNKLRALLD